MKPWNVFLRGKTSDTAGYKNITANCATQAKKAVFLSMCDGFASMRNQTLQVSIKCVVMTSGRDVIKWLILKENVIIKIILYIVWSKEYSWYFFNTGQWMTTMFDENILHVSLYHVYFRLFFCTHNWKCTRCQNWHTLYVDFTASPVGHSMFAKQDDDVCL